MPKRQDYESDDGFVEDASKTKKARSAGNELKKAEGKATVSSATQKDDDNNEYWEISRTRRVQVSDFKGTTMVNIREFYEKDGKMLPGKKGISLSIDQFTAVIDILPQLESVLQSKGITVPRPKYDTPAASSNANDEDEDEEQGKQDEQDDEDEDEDEAEGDVVTSSSKATGGRLDKFKHRANHEATSDEDEEE